MLRPWNLEICLQRSSGTGLHIQIVQALIEEVRRGRLLRGAPMPGSRELAERLSVNRKTVVLAYEELIAQGWLVAQGRRGTFVAAEFPLAECPARGAGAGSAREPIAPAGRQGMPAQAAPDDGSRQPEWLDFSDGLPDARMIPYAALSRAFRHALLKTSRNNQLAYGDPRGAEALRQSLAQMLNMQRGLACTIDSLCLVRGCQMGIFLAARVLIRPGDCAVFETLSYSPAREAFRASGASILNIAQDGQGMRLDALEECCRRHRVRAVYVTPHHQYPTTVMMPADRRVKLLALAEKYGFYIIEDDYDHEFHFGRLPIFPVASLDRSGRVLYIGSLSKGLAPGLRVGYIAASSAIVDQCAAMIMGIDRQGSAITELAVNELIVSGELKRHLRRAVRAYGQRRDAAIQAVGAELAQLVDFTPPPGGLALWLKPRREIEVGALQARAERHGLRFVPQQQFFAGTGAVPGLRIGYANLDEASFVRGIRLLRTVLLAA